MQLTKALNTMGRNDAKLIGRDSFLAGLLGYVAVMALFLRFALPWLEQTVQASEDIQISAAEFYPLVIGYLVIYTGGLIAGMIVGFVVLDERDDHTLTALLVTPLPLNAYIGYRLLVPGLMGFVFILLQFLIINQTPLPIWQLLPIVAVAALVGPIVALFMAVFAANKVQGFAMLKIIGSSGLLLVAAWFVPEPFEFLFGLFPPYWAVKAYWAALAGESLWWIFLIIGVVMSGAVLAYLVRRFNKVAYATA